MSKEDDLKRYEAAMHAVQTGVAFQMEAGGNPAETTAKHLRVGVNSALVNQGALVALLVKKGVITEEEYIASLATFAEREAADYTERVRKQFGYPNIKLA